MKFYQCKRCKGIFSEKEMIEYNAEGKTLICPEEDCSGTKMVEVEIDGRKNKGFWGSFWEN